MIVPSLLALFTSWPAAFATDLHADAAFLIQSDLDRWQIEVAPREGKTLLGVGQAQVRHSRAVARQPAFVMAVYSALLAVWEERPVCYHPTPAWYDGPCGRRWRIFGASCARTCWRIRNGRHRMG